MLLFCSLSHVQLFWDSMDYSLPGSSVHGISRQEYWSGLPFPSPGALPDSGLKPKSPETPALAGRFFSGSVGKESACRCERPRTSPWLSNSAYTVLVFLPGESQGQRSLAGYSPLGCKELDMMKVTEYAHHSFYQLTVYISCSFRMAWT